MKNKDIIIEIGGGLGNQMFQYALYLKFLSLGKKCKLYYDKENFIHNGFQINNAFGSDAKLCTKDEVERVVKKNKSFKARLLMKFGGSGRVYWEHNKGYEYKPGIFKLKGSAYLQGCWLSEMYFKDIEASIRRKFVFININDKTRELANRILEDEKSVSIHIRRGDYLKSKIHKQLDYHKYLKNSLEYIKQFVKDPVMYIFSDDADYACHIINYLNIPETHSIFVDWNLNSESFNDMYLMSLCKHNIIANSTFSWWGAWLNRNPSKIVISPAEWFENSEMKVNSILPKYWHSIMELPSE